MAVEKYDKVMSAPGTAFSSNPLFVWLKVKDLEEMQMGAARRGQQRGAAPGGGLVQRQLFGGNLGGVAVSCWINSLLCDPPKPS